jgi:hypothetical protein
MCEGLPLQPIRSAVGLSGGVAPFLNWSTDLATAPAKRVRCANEQLCLQLCLSRQLLWVDAGRRCDGGFGAYRNWPYQTVIIRRSAVRPVPPVGDGE